MSHNLQEFCLNSVNMGNVRHACPYKVIGSGLSLSLHSLVVRNNTNDSATEKELVVKIDLLIVILRVND